MQGRHGVIIHSVKDPPASCLWPKQSMLCRFGTHKVWHHTHHKHSCREFRNPCAKPQRRRQITCKKSAAEATLGSHKVEAYNSTAARLKSIKALHTHGRVISKPFTDGEVYIATADYPENYDLTEFEPLDRHSQLSQNSGLHVPFCLKSIARHHRKRVLCSFIITPSPQNREMAAFKWLKNLGSVYGVSLIFLVGLGYWIQGFRCFPWFAVNFYFKDVLTVDPGTLQIVQNTVNLPMVAKPMYGIVSDTIYIRGAHRVPYLVIGGFLQALSWGTIAFLPGGGSSISIIAILLALSNLGASMVDVANDALVAECAKKKKSNGELQSFAWFSTAVGGVLGNLVAAFALSRVDFRLMFSMFGMLLLCQAGKSMGVNEGSFGLRMPQVVNEDIEKRIEGVSEFSVLAKKRPIWLLPSATNGLEASPYALAFETTENGWRQASMDVKMVDYISMNTAMENGWRQCSMDVVSADYASLHLARSEAMVVQEPAKVAGMRQQFTDLILLVKQPEILYPLSWFMASYAMIPTLAGTMFFFQTQHLNIDPSVVGMSKVMGQVGLMGGSMVYSRYLKGVPLRKLLASIQILLCMCMMFDMLLVKRMNVGLGIPDAALVLGASAFVDAINQFKILPFMVLLAQLCPAGSEGSLLAAFMSVQCLATIISGYMGVTLASMLHITGNDFSELPTGIFVQSMAALLPLFWISFIPDGSKQPRDGKNI